MAKYRPYYRRRMPHQQPPGCVLFVTFGLRGSLPQPVEERIRIEANLLRENLRGLPGDAPELVAAWKRLFHYADEHYDKSENVHYLRNETAANAVVESIYKGQELNHYRLHRYCDMPNHVHLLLEPLPQNIIWTDKPPEASWPPLLYIDEGKALLKSYCPLDQLDWKPLCDIMHSMKRTTSPKVARTASVNGSIWMPENFDHWIRNGGEYERGVKYIDDNPVSARLASDASKRPWSTAGERAAAACRQIGIP